MTLICNDLVLYKMNFFSFCFQMNLEGKQQGQTEAFRVILKQHMVSTFNNNNNKILIIVETSYCHIM